MGAYLPLSLLRGFSCVLIFASFEHNNGAVLDFGQVRKVAAGIKKDIIAWRRELHSYPELMYQENKTSGLIQTVLQDMGVSFSAGWAKNTRQHAARPIAGMGRTGVVAEIGTGKPPIVALRSDMDALPIQEDTPVAFRSKSDGKMHACGHDGHMSMLLGAAKLLHRLNAAATLPGTVRLIFQPAEEGGAGAKRMWEEGVLKDVSRIFGMHLWPSLPSGSIGGRAGVAMAAGDFFEFKVKGAGAHGAMPHKSLDPVTAAAAIIQALQTIVSRETDPLDSAVISVTKLTAGDAFNVIPAEAIVGGTIRALSVVGMELLQRRLEEVANQVAAAYRCTVDNLTFMPDFFPPTSNDADLWKWLQSPEAGVKGDPGSPAMQWDLPPTMGSEDFAFYTQNVPGAFIFLGQGSGKSKLAGASDEVWFTNTTVHSPRFHMDEDVLHLGAALHTQLALRSLYALRSSTHGEL